MNSGVAESWYPGSLEYTVSTRSSSHFIKVFTCNSGRLPGQLPSRAS